MMIDQESFEQGLIMGLGTALVVLREGGGLSGVEAQRDEIKELVAQRRNGGLSAKAEAVAGDIFCMTPLADPRDFGLEATPVEIEAARLSRLRWQTPRPAGGGDPGGIVERPVPGVCEHDSPSE